MESNSVSPMPELAPIAEFDKTPPTPPEDTLPMDDLPPPPATVNMQEDKEKEKEKEAPHRRYVEETDWGCGNWFEYILVVLLSCILLFGALGVTIYWVIQYQGGIGLKGSEDKKFNLHPTLMVGGFITLSGFSILLYRICRCCRRTYLKLLHAFLHALTIPCVGYGFYVAYQWHKNADGNAHFYTIHSWIGMVALGLFALQFVVGFFCFLLLMCCDESTSSFRACIVPIHASFGITIFWIAIAACCTGLMQKATKSLGPLYPSLNEEAIVVNTIGISIVALGILIAYVLHRDEFRIRALVLVRTGEI